MDQRQRAEGLAGGAVWAAWVTGFLSLVGFLVTAAMMDWSAAALCLIAAAIAFSGVANAILRD